MTQIATLFRGEEDPALDFDPQPGDLWMDTTGGQPPFTLKGWSGAEWVLQPLIAKDANGATIATVAITVEGRIHATGPGSGLTIEPDGHINLSTPTAGIDISAAGAVRVGAGLGTILLGADGALALYSGEQTLEVGLGAPTVNGTPL